MRRFQLVLFRMIKSRKIRWIVHVELMEEEEKCV
jgi:hypothetical protein